MEADLIPNIPRVYTAIAESIACLAIFLLLQKRRKWPLIFLGTATIQIFLQIFVGTWSLIFWIPGMCLNVLWMMITIYSCSQITRRELYYCCCKAFILAEFVASFAWQIYCYLILGRYGNDSILSIPVILVQYLLLFSLYYVINKKLHHYSMVHQLTNRDILLASLTVLIIFTMGNIGFMLSNTSYTLGDTISIFIFRTLINLSGLCIIFIQENQKYEAYLGKELSLMNTMYQSQYEQYTAYKESSEIIQRQFHDLKHQLDIIRNEENTEIKNQYLQNMEDAIKTYSSTITTGHAVLDTILTSKNSICIDNHVTFTCFADGKQVEFLDIMDLCALFGNALDNSIESVKKISDPEKRLIDMKLQRKANFLVLNIKNTYSEKPIHVDGHLVTTKKDKDIHGYGIKSIAKIAEKYDGSLKIDIDDVWFQLKIMFPLKNSNRSVASV